MIDGEIVCLDARGRSNFKSLLFRREWPYFYAFDLLGVDSEGLRKWPLVERKRRLRRLIPSVPTRLLYVDHIKARGKDLFEVACAHDLEGIVGKLASGRYHADGTSTNWLKIKNASYTQMTARHELFQRRTGARKRRPIAPALIAQRLPLSPYDPQGPFGPPRQGCGVLVVLIVTFVPSTFPSSPPLP